MSDENGLVYMRARYYSPTLKRFINADVVAGSITNAITLNRYAYANGNPVSNVDPFGLSPDVARGNNGSASSTWNTDWYWPYLIQSDSTHDGIALSLLSIYVNELTDIDIIYDFWRESYNHQGINVNMHNGNNYSYILYTNEHTGAIFYAYHSTSTIGKQLTDKGIGYGYETKRYVEITMPNTHNTHAHSYTTYYTEPCFKNESGDGSKTAVNSAWVENAPEFFADISEVVTGGKAYNKLAGGGTFKQIFSKPTGGRPFNVDATNINSLLDLFDPM